MPTVDSKGRILIPKEVRERLGITPGTEVEVREEGGKAIIEPEKDPEDILKRMERLVAETSADRGETTPLPDEGVETTLDAMRTAQTVRDRFGSEDPDEWGPGVEEDEGA